MNQKMSENSETNTSKDLQLKDNASDNIVKSADEEENLPLNDGDITAEQTCQIPETEEVSFSYKSYKAQITFVVVLGLSLLYGFIHYRYSTYNLSVGAIVGTMLAPIIMSYLIGALIASINYLFSKKFRNTFYLVTIISSILLSYLYIKSEISTKHISAEKASSISNNTVIAVTDKLELDKVYDNQYYTIKYPQNWLIQDANNPAFIHGIFFENSPSMADENYIKLTIGVIQNSSKSNFDLVAYSDILLTSFKQGLDKQNLDGIFSKVTITNIGNKEFYHFTFKYKAGGIDIIDAVYLINSKNHAIVSDFITTSEKWTKVEQDILSSIVLK